VWEFQIQVRKEPRKTKHLTTSPQFYRLGSHICVVVS